VTNIEAVPQLCICVGMTLQEAEALLIAATLRHTNGNMRAAAAVLKIDRTTLYNKVKRYAMLRSRQLESSLQSEVANFEQLAND